MLFIEKKFQILLILLLTIYFAKGQNTIGTLYNSDDAYEAFTLFTLHTETYLINNCGEVINQWSSDYPPGNAVYLLENGNLLRAGNTNSDYIIFGGVGGIIELFDWEGNIIWSMLYDSPQYRQHHDICPLPNGNILVLAATIMTDQEIIQAGRNPFQLLGNVFYNEQILEIEPTGSNGYNIVWEWNIKDHLIQDYDSTKDNYGNVGLNPQLLNINFLNGFDPSPNWLHINSIQYNSELDQIIMSVRNLSEIFIIDHSTTTAEAASHSGGNSGMGGDLLYRWGNPEAYNQGDENSRILFGQHYPHWIPDGYPDAGQILLFNNGFGRLPRFSEVLKINPPLENNGNYTYVENSSYGPEVPSYTYSDPPDFYSAIISSAQQLPNGNILICEGRTGEIIEIDSMENIVWAYTTPIDNNTGNIFTQGETPLNNLTFRAIKYSSDYPAFIGKDLTPGNPIVESENIDNCGNLSNIEQSLQTVKLYPNPTKGEVLISGIKNFDKITILDLFGKEVITFLNQTEIDLSTLNNGMYLLRIEKESQYITKKIIKI